MKAFLAEVKFHTDPKKWDKSGITTVGLCVLPLGREDKKDNRIFISEDEGSKEAMMNATLEKGQSVWVSASEGKGKTYYKILTFLVDGRFAFSPFADAPADGVTGVQSESMQSQGKGYFAVSSNRDLATVYAHEASRFMSQIMREMMEANLENPEADVTAHQVSYLAAEVFKATWPGVSSHIISQKKTPALLVDASATVREMHNPPDDEDLDGEFPLANPTGDYI